VEGDNCEAQAVVRDRPLASQWHGDVGSLQVSPPKQPYEVSKLMCCCIKL